MIIVGNNVKAREISEGMKIMTLRKLTEKFYSYTVPVLVIRDDNSSSYCVYYKGTCNCENTSSVVNSREVLIKEVAVFYAYLIDIV